MRALYTSPHRGLIDEPTSIHDMYPDVLGNTFRYLSQEDLLSAKSSCRAWKPVAQKLIHARVKLEGNVMNALCGYQLDSLVFRSESYQISTLIINLDEYYSLDFIPMIAQIVGPTLSSLDIDFDDWDFNYFKVLKIFFSQCPWIRNLCIRRFRFGQDEFSPAIKSGFASLKQLDLIECSGNAQLFIETTPIPSLKSFRFESSDNNYDREGVNVDAAVMRYGHTLITLNAQNCFVSPANLVKIAECCPVLEKLILFTGDELELSIADIKVISTLPRLRHFAVDRWTIIEDDASKSLALYKGLKHLETVWDESLNAALRVVGGNLRSLVLWDVRAEEIDGIIEHCPGMQNLDICLERPEIHVSNDVVELTKNKLKNGLKMLAKLKVNGMNVRLGTDWEGTDEEGFWC
jgi:hypothetical protein